MLWPGVHCTAAHRRRSLPDERCSSGCYLLGAIVPGQLPAQGTFRRDSNLWLTGGWQANDERRWHREARASLAARAAKELEDQAHIPSRTIAKLLLDLDRGTEQLDDRTVLVIDEAAMVGTKALARLFDAADAGGSRLILVGDPHQLQSIEAGGVLRGLEKRMPTIGLTENRRQRHAWERVALADLRAGEVGSFLTAYQANGRHDRRA
ncbi:MAG: AAA family ATPase [Actinomycetota bacterium]|nr:AAA family ATPase [Actinomycetota bacterium]